MIDKLETIKKGTKLITKQLGFPTSAVAMESIKQGRGLKKVLLIDVKGSEMSTFVSDIVRVL